ncbi:hypothetical protein ACQPYK_49475 (plasmid) [Streptosporangium sp. CA-135522]|uniref:hypothetical protein n=1 Tax=Streptosporangium sp. CA-135522 TaxID=3240072 RepID=UPI003D8F0CFF
MTFASYHPARSAPDSEVSLLITEKLFGADLHPSLVAMALKLQGLPVAAVQIHLPDRSPQLLPLLSRLTDIIKDGDACGAVGIGYGAAAYITPALNGLQVTLDDAQLDTWRLLHYENGHYCSHLDRNGCPDKPLPVRRSLASKAAADILAVAAPAIYTISPSGRVCSRKEGRVITCGSA